MNTKQEEEQRELIILWSGPWWAYMLLRGGLLRALVNAIEDTLTICGRTLLLVFLIYCGIKSGAFLVSPDLHYPSWLEMLMFGLQLAGLEGSIPGLARHSAALRAKRDEEGAERAEWVMKAARAMTILSIGEGVLHLVGTDPTILKWVSGALLIARGVVITGFLIELARLESKGPRILSREEHEREREQEVQASEQARTIANLQNQLKALREHLDTGQQEVSRLRREVSTLQQQVNTGQQEVSRLQRELDSREQELTGLRESLSHGQQWQEGRVSRLQHQLDTEQAATTTLRQQLQTAELETEGLRTKLDSKHHELERVQVALSREQQEVSTLQQQVNTGQQEVSRLQQAVSTLRDQVSSVQMSSEQEKVDSGQGKIVRLESRTRKGGQTDAAIAEQIKNLLADEPGLSGRAIAARLNISPTTANRWKSLIEHGSSSSECINEY